MPPNKRAELYRAVGIDRVIIDGNEFTDYKAFSFLWEKSYVKSPVRSGDGTIGNLNSYATFLTPHLKIDFSLMSIDSYRTLMKLIYEKNEFTVTCYDVVNDTTTTNKMYFTTEEMPKLWTMVEALNGNEDAIELLGVQDYVVEMVGTNAPMEEIDILYYDNNGKLIVGASHQAIIGSEFIVDYNFIAPSGYRFDGEWKDKNGKVYRNGDVVKVNAYNKETMAIELYAQVVNTNQYTLSFSYGIGKTPLSQTGEAINSVEIREGQTFSNAISNANITLSDGITKFSFPKSGTGVEPVEYNGKKYNDVYVFDGWYTTTVANSVSQVEGSTTFDKKSNLVIYQIYKTNKYGIRFITNSTMSFKDIYIEYKQQIPLPTPARDGYNFVGWYTDGRLGEESKFNESTMPPVNITLYGKWEISK